MDNCAYIHYGTLFTGAELFAVIRKLAPAKFKKALQDEGPEEAIATILRQHNEIADQLAIECLCMADGDDFSSDERCNYVVHLPRTGGGCSHGGEILSDDALVVPDADKQQLKKMWKELKLHKLADKHTGWVMFTRRE